MLRHLVYRLSSVCLLGTIATTGLARDQNANTTIDVTMGFQITTFHSGFTSTTLQQPLKIKWSVNLPGTVSYPIIESGKVFVIAGGNTNTPSTLYALSTFTGKILWSQPRVAGAGSWIGAAYENGVLFAVPTYGPQPLSGAMYAFSALDGHTIWSTNLPGQYSFSSAPTARNGIVYTSGAGSGGTVYAVRGSDGLLLWTAAVENGDSSAPAVTQSGVYVSYVCPQTYRFNPTTGQQVWHYSGGCEGGGGESAAVYGSRVYVRDLYNFPTDGIMLDTTTGTLIGGFNSQYSPAFSGQDAFYTEPGTVTAVNISTQNLIWSNVPSAGETYSCAPIVVSNVLYIGTSSGNLLGYQVSSGQQVFSMNLGQPISCGEYFSVPLAGMSAGQGLLVVPAGSKLVALQ